MTVAQTDRWTHKGDDSKTPEETNRQKCKEGGPRGQPADKKRYTVQKGHYILVTYFILLISSSQLNVFIGCSAAFFFIVNLYITIPLHMLLTFLWQCEKSFIVPIKLI